MLEKVEKIKEALRRWFARNPEEPRIPPPLPAAEPNYVKGAIIGGVVGGVVQEIAQEAAHHAWDLTKEVAPMIGDFLQYLS
ncbi:hypothetical protein [Streptomyces sp. FL07-04A]|uniref:hypothetical protein n=1 Tax=Streptomyces sp. FL07-04A TaxID=3028658 RepID=UPI0029BACAE7|nr:hypothetical protein [Streptomyces sp. FL07-04A]MDX3576452.1 hypothetical protein [Streptomyces sp. FL07-04A]